MEHVAILARKWKLLQKIISHEKTIESRWYKTKIYPWNKVGEGEVVYFKESGFPVTVKAKVAKVIQIENLTRVKTKSILRKYYRRLGIEVKDLGQFNNHFKDKKYCILIFLKNNEIISKPFNISKSGFGSQTAWISVANIKKIKVRNL